MKPSSPIAAIIHSILMVSLVLAGCGNDCNEVECENNGVCVDGLCECPPGWVGDDCSQIDAFTGACNGVNTLTFDNFSYALVQP